MALQHLTASPNPNGNRIDLSWTIPADSTYTGVRVVRRTGSYPENPDDGVNVAQDDALEAASDTGLRGEQVYYYMVFPYVGLPTAFEIDDKNRMSAMATSPQEFGAYMYDLLPSIYRRYDKDTQSLKQFLEIFGSQFDQMQSFAKAALKLARLDDANGAFLPLLAQWIGWRIDNKLSLRAQRGEIRNAPALYKTVGLIPTMEATAKRMSGWESRTKEFVHNVFSSNRAETLNIWSRIRDAGGNWSENPVLTSMDYAYDGRPASALDSNEIRWLFYHTQRKGNWEIWFKTSPTETISSSFQDQLSDGPISAVLLNALNRAGLVLLPSAAITTVTPDRAWRIGDGTNRYVVERIDERLLVYSVSAGLAEFSASEPLVVGEPAIHKHPAVALQGQLLWLFWSTHDQRENRWRIRYRTRSDARWSETGPAEPDPTVDIDRNPFASGGVYDPGPQRRFATPAVDGGDRLWLFWLENDGAGWRLRYNRHDGANWGTPVDLPVAGGDPRVSADVCVLIEASIPTPRIYLFWSRMAETSTPSRERWEVAYAVKEDLNLDDANWSAVQSLPKDTANDDHHDREPCVILSGTDVELFWSSNRGDAGWSIWRSILTDHTTNTWDAAQTELLTPGAYSQRNPLPLVSDGNTLLIHRSNQGIAFKSRVYGATETVDERYAGSTTMDVRQGQKLVLRKRYEDIQHYTYDSGQAGVRGNDDWIARDTVGVYLKSSTLSEEEIESGVARLKPVLKEFMPATDRAVFITTRELHAELVYSYGRPVSADSRFITSTYEDDFTSLLDASALVENEDFTDSLDT
jgi:phage tail-like protein